MKLRSVLALFVSIVAMIGSVMAQSSKYAVRNVRYVDSIKQVVDSVICKKGLSYPSTHNTSEIGKVRSIIHAVNFFLNHDLSEGRIDSVVATLRAVKTKKSAARNGLVHLLTIDLSTEYLHSKLAFDFLGDILVCRKFTLHPYTRVRCAKYGWDYPDFWLLDTLYARQIDYPIRLIDWEDLLLDKLDTASLRWASQLYTNYRFGLGYFIPAVAGDQVGGFLRSQYDPDSSCCYSQDVADRRFVQLIRDGRMDVIRDVLFSPNYFFAINAMEAMVYLSETGKMTVSDAERARMELLKSDTSQIVMDHSDVRYILRGYKELGQVTPQTVVAKYKQTMQ